MTENISIKIVKLEKLNFTETNEKEHSYAIYEIEPYQYGDSNVTKMKIFYEKEGDLDVFEEGKKYNIKLGKDKVFVDQAENILIINNADWNAQETWLQKATDTTKKATDKVGNTSSGAVKKTGKGLEKAGKKFQESSGKDK